MWRWVRVARELQDSKPHTHARTHTLSHCSVLEEEGVGITG